MFGKMLSPMAMKSMKGGRVGVVELEMGGIKFGRKYVCLRDKL